MFGKKKAIVINKDGSIVEQPNGSLVKKVIGGAAVLAAGLYIFSQGEQKGYKKGAADMKAALDTQNLQPENNDNENEEGSE